MISLARHRTTDSIPSSFRGATPRNRLVALMKKAQAQIANGEAVHLDIDSKWSVTKDQLLTESNQKCAYCETHTSVVAFGDVEHYRPKSKYWWLAYVYDNYLASCSVCNQRFKGAKFEFAGVELKAPNITAATTEDELKEISKTIIPDPLDLAAVAAYENLHRAEKPLILNPYIDDPEQVFAWKALDGIREVEVTASNTFPDSDQLLDAAERIYGINRTELKRHRYRQYEIYNLSRVTAETPAVPQDLRDMHMALVKSMKNPDSPYSAMVRFFENDRGPL